MFQVSSTSLFVLGATVPSGPGPLHSRVFYITQNDTLQSIRFLWTSDELVTETSTSQHTTITIDIHPCLRRNSNPQFHHASGHWNRRLQTVVTTNIKYLLSMCCLFTERVFNVSAALARSVQRGILLCFVNNELHNM
jgi:hypothetical protein